MDVGFAELPPWVLMGSRPPRSRRRRSFTLLAEIPAPPANQGKRREVVVGTVWTSASAPTAPRNCHGPPGPSRASRRFRPVVLTIVYWSGLQPCACLNDHRALLEVPMRAQRGVTTIATAVGALAAIQQPQRLHLRILR